MFNTTVSRRLLLVLGVVLPLLILAFLPRTSHEEAQFRVIEFVVQRGIDEAPKERKSARDFRIRAISIYARDENGGKVPANTALVGRLRRRFPEIHWVNQNEKRRIHHSSHVEVPKNISSNPFVRQVELIHLVDETLMECSARTKFLVSRIPFGRFRGGNGVITSHFNANAC